MKHRLLLAAMAVVSSSYVVSGCAKAGAQEAVVTASSPSSVAPREVELLVYSGNFGMVQETRSVTLEKGVNRVGLTDVSKALDQNSVMFNWPDRKDAQVRASTYDLGMGESGQLLKRFLGKEVELVYDADNGQEGRRVRGTLEVADPGNVVVKAGGKYIVNPSATIEAPSDAGIVTIPQLTAEVDSGSAGSAKLGLSYLTGGLSWSADYTLTLNKLTATEQVKEQIVIGVAAEPTPARASLDCWASVVNKTGTDFPDAKLKFVAGSPNRATRVTAGEGGRVDGFNVGGAMYGGGRGQAFEALSYDLAPSRLNSDSVGELHAYPYEAAATIRQDQINRVRMMGVEGVALKKWYAISMPTMWRDGYQGNPDQRLTATLGINFKNDDASKLGKPMPAGAVRVYEPDAQGRPQYIGAASIQDTPKNAKVSLTLSNVFDVYAQSRIVKSDKVGRRKVRKTWEITVHNEKSSAQQVRLVQNFYGAYKLVSESDKSAKLNATPRQWSLNVAPGGEVKLKVVAEF